MSHGSAHQQSPGTQGGHGPAAGAAFPPKVWSLFQAEDRQAARNIVILFTGLFIVGLVMYSIVDLIVSTGP